MDTVSHKHRFLTRGAVEPGKRFYYWAIRNLRLIPDDWRKYYYTLLRQEMFASRLTTGAFEIFSCASEGYRKGLWVLAKYGQERKALPPPSPYDNFWHKASTEERMYALRRANYIKQMAATRDGNNVIGDTNQCFSRNCVTRSPYEQSAAPTTWEEDMPEPSDDEFGSMLLASLDDDNVFKRITGYESAKEYVDGPQRKDYTFDDEEEEEEEEAEEREEGDKVDRSTKDNFKLFNERYPQATTIPVNVGGGRKAALANTTRPRGFDGKPINTDDRWSPDAE
jgi:hypothetical protein